MVYRPRLVPTLVGTIAVRVGRLLDRSKGSQVDPYVGISGNVPVGHPLLLVRPNVWMSYRYAAHFTCPRTIGLFVEAAGLPPNTVMLATHAPEGAAEVGYSQIINGLARRKNFSGSRQFGALSLDSRPSTRSRDC